MRKKAFTLVELLVVIAVIALLLAILLPSLNKAKELANRIVCGQHLKTLGQASNTYANAFDGYFVPASFYAYGPNPDSANDNVPDYYRYRWINNRAFISYIQKKSLTGDDGAAYEKAYALPKEFLCPSDQIAKNPSNAAQTVLVSYAYNGTDWGWLGLNSNKYCGHKDDLLKAPADKLQFTDAGADWWCQWPGADYRLKWDDIGQAPLWDYRPVKDRPTPPAPHVYGAVYYRHNEGANVGFYDGHVEYLKKTEIFNKDDYDATTTLKRAGMWTASGWY
jgi:prepilin-type N-terminal cleavage/methylation domain-containing protein/prepilin-type processing-associated H-X9-DG protein